MTPTPHQPDSSIGIEALRNRMKDGLPHSIYSITKEGLSALLDRLERAEAAAGAVPEGQFDLETEHAHYRAWLGSVNPLAVGYQTSWNGWEARARLFAAAPKAAPSQQAEAAPETNSTYIHRCERCNGLGHVETDTSAAAPSEPVSWRWKWADDLDEPWRYSPSQPTDSGKPGVVMDALYLATPPAQDAGTGVLHANAGPTPEQQDRDWRATRPHAAPMACSTCYGTGYGVDCKPCPSGCRAIANSGRTE